MFCQIDLFVVPQLTLVFHSSSANIPAMAIPVLTAAKEDALWSSLFAALDTTFDLELDTIIDEYGDQLCACDSQLASLLQDYPSSCLELSLYLRSRRESLAPAAV